MQGIYLKGVCMVFTFNKLLFNNSKLNTCILLNISATNIVCFMFICYPVRTLHVCNVKLVMRTIELLLSTKEVFLRPLASMVHSLHNVTLLPRTAVFVPHTVTSTFHLQLSLCSNSVALLLNAAQFPIADTAAAFN